ncbi:MAG: hypothetical protein JXA73_00320 [Acidobacteria bacterium]|nr:hypothetical protein [Acidobacteriota bacterium]
MRIDTANIPQSLVESPKTIEKKELINGVSTEGNLEESQSLPFPPFGSSRTYSLASLKSAVDYHAKFLTVAENNLAAANHPPTIPQGIRDRLNSVK